MLAKASVGERDNVQRQFDRLASDPSGCFALIDYVNFKGEGTLATERYKGEGWGLLQVLENMNGSGGNAVREFIDSARKILARRIRNSPPERHEERWLPGWTKRVESY